MKKILPNSSLWRYVETIGTYSANHIYAIRYALGCVVLPRDGVAGECDTRVAHADVYLLDAFRDLLQG